MLVVCVLVFVACGLLCLWQLVVRCSPFVIWCVVCCSLLLVIRRFVHSLFVVRCAVFDVYCLLFVVCRFFFACRLACVVVYLLVCLLLLGLCWLLFIIGLGLFWAVHCLLVIVVSSLLIVTCCKMFAVFVFTVC